MRMTVLVASLVGFIAATLPGSAAPVYGTLIGTNSTHIDFVHWSDAGYTRPGRGYCFYHPHHGRCR
jgi:hypothetical protein